jgi:hypothetical protein
MELRAKIANIVYELNVDPENVDGVVDQIAEAVGPNKIVIDMAGAMDKLTPDMLDATRDIMIETYAKKIEDMGWHDADVPPSRTVTASVLYEYAWEGETVRAMAHGATLQDGKWQWSAKREGDKVLKYHLVPKLPGF